MPEEEKREKLSKVIQQWNNTRLDLFEISQPDENLEFHGVMRFYFEDKSGNVATKCLRVSSSSSTQDVVELLSEKFRPDMKMLSNHYLLYEIHGSKERKLELNERPLVVQLNWNKDNREGRFVLKKDKDKTEKENGLEKASVMQNFKRTLSKKDKKKPKLELVNTNGTRSMDDSSSSQTKDTKKQRKTNTSIPCLPIAIRFNDNTEEAFLSAVINYTNSSTVHFKLSPAYVLYATTRSILSLSPKHGSASSGPGWRHRVTVLTGKMVERTRKVLQRQQTMAGALAFWMANSSELLHFLKHDTELGPLTEESQKDLSRLVHQAYRSLIYCLQNELEKHLPTFLIDPEQHGALPKGIELVLNTLMNCMSLCRRSKVNPALTIQLFSQLFHFISAWLFNRLVVGQSCDPPGLRSHYWGAALRQRLTPIEAWAERQGLELATDCHLGHIIQATTLLTMNKYSKQNAKDVQKNCFKLNSLQLQTLFGGYHYADNEPRIPTELIDSVVSAAARAGTDQLTRDVPLEESLDLQLPFLLPDRGYSSDSVHGIPPGLREFLEPICRKGLCTLIPQTNSNGDWTVHFSEAASTAETEYLEIHREPEVVTITLNKPLNSGMGVSIVAAKGVGQRNLGIYIKSIVKGGPAEMNGRLTCGDQLLSVDGQTLVGLSQERAAAIMMQTGPVVTLQVAKYAASFHGLVALLSDPPTERIPVNAGYVEAKPNGSLMLYSDVDFSLNYSKRQKEQKMQRNRQLYRSNPNMLNLALEEDDGQFDPKVKRKMAAVSTINLCTGREYLTLPTPKSQDKDTVKPSHHPTFRQSLRPLGKQDCKERTFMRQALSQENLCVDSERPLVDKRHEMWQLQRTPSKYNQTTNHFSSFPVRQSLSSHDLLSDNSKRHSAISGPIVWNIPYSNSPTTSIQPIRIDIPLTRATKTNPPLTTFQSPSQQTVNTSHTPKIYANPLQKVPQTMQDPIYDCPISNKLPQTSQFGRSQKPQVNVSPTKHVTFQVPQTQRHILGQKDKIRDTHPEERRKWDVWKREEQEKLEEKRRLEQVQVMEQEVQQLQAKVKRSVEENDRLRKLSLEFEFQKRLREIEEREGEEEDDLEMMKTIQELDTRAQSKKSPGGNVNGEKQTTSILSHRNNQETTDAKPNGLCQDANDMAQTEKQDKLRTLAPEKLTFKERQQLFSLASSA